MLSASGTLTTTATAKPIRISRVVTHAFSSTKSERLTNSVHTLLGGGSRYSLMPKSHTAPSHSANSSANSTSAPARRRSHVASAMDDVLTCLRSGKPSAYPQASAGGIERLLEHGSLRAASAQPDELLRHRLQQRHHFGVFAPGKELERLAGAAKHRPRRQLGEGGKALLERLELARARGGHGEMPFDEMRRGAGKARLAVLMDLAPVDFGALS